MTCHQTRSWKRILERLTRESDLAKVQILACMLEEAIFQRQQELAVEANAFEEEQALHQANSYLYRVRVDKLGFPDWRKRAG